MPPRSNARLKHCERRATGGNTIYSCGNGGSASIASQMVVDLVKGGSYGKQTPRIKMIGLTDSIATVTAYANDVSYDSGFCGATQELGNP